MRPFTSEVTVTPERGRVADVDEATAFVTVRQSAELGQWPIATLGHALNGAAGVMVQQSASGQVSPFMRGLTGYHVLNLIDGVRFNNAVFRSGPNQYLAFVDPGQADRVEAMLGPASSQYGSDALGGAIQLLTPLAEYSDGAGYGVRVGANLLAASADTSHAAEANVPIHIRTADFELRLFSTIMTLGTPQDVTLQELRIETLFPADAASEHSWNRIVAESPHTHGATGSGSSYGDASRV